MSATTRRTTTMLLLGGALLLSVGACRTVYVDQPAPAGTVPPAPIPATRVDPGTTVRERGELAVEAPPEPGVASRALPGTSEEERADFRRGYLRHDEPRMVIFLDRALSDRVEEWEAVIGISRGASRDEFKMGDDYTTDPPESGWTTRDRTEGEVTNLNAGRAADGSRFTPASEGWRWQLADGFQSELLEVPVVLVDRATILRLTGADSARTGPEYATLANKKVEMDALQEYADILVEVLVTREPAPAGPYLFRVTAKGIESGTLIASITSRADALAPARFQAGPDGYEKAPVSPEEAGRGLARALMSDLARRWR